MCLRSQGWATTEPRRTSDQGSSVFDQDRRLCGGESPLGLAQRDIGAGLVDLEQFERRARVGRVEGRGFDDAGQGPRLLRSMLEGGAEARPANARLHVTANRRHIVSRDLREQDPINPRDVIDDKLALADRFGLSLGFHVCDQDSYVAMVSGYARAYGLSFDPLDAIAWATQRGSRSGRVAWQYVVELAGRAGKPV